MNASTDITREKFDRLMLSIDPQKDKSPLLIVNSKGAIEKTNTLSYAWQKVCGFFGGEDLCHNKLIGLSVINYLDYAVFHPVGLEMEKMKILINVAMTLLRTKKIATTEETSRKSDIDSIAQKISLCFKNNATTQEKATLHAEIENFNQEICSKGMEKYVSKIPHHLVEPAEEPAELPREGPSLTEQSTISTPSLVGRLSAMPPAQPQEKEKIKEEEKKEATKQKQELPEQKKQEIGEKKEEFAQKERGQETRELSPEELGDRLPVEEKKTKPVQTAQRENDQLKTAITAKEVETVKPPEVKGIADVATTQIEQPVQEHQGWMNTATQISLLGVGTFLAGIAIYMFLPRLLISNPPENNGFKVTPFKSDEYNPLDTAASSSHKIYDDFAMDLLKDLSTSTQQEQINAALKRREEMKMFYPHSSLTQHLLEDLRELDKNNTNQPRVLPRILKELQPENVKPQLDEQANAEQTPITETVEAEQSSPAEPRAATTSMEKTETPAHIKELLKKALSTSSPADWRALAVAHIENRDLDSAASAYFQADDMHLGGKKPMNEEMERLIKLQETTHINWADWMHLANEYVYLTDYETAAFCFANIAEFEKAATYYEMNGDFEKALSYYLRAVNEGNEHCIDHVQKLYDTKKIEIPQNLIKHIKEVSDQKLDQKFQELLVKAEGSDSNPTDWRALADIYVEKSAPKSAVNWYLKACQADDHGWTDLGHLYLKLNEYERALFCYEKGAVVARHLTAKNFFNPFGGNIHAEVHLPEWGWDSAKRTKKLNSEKLLNIRNKIEKSLKEIASLENTLDDPSGLNNAYYKLHAAYLDLRDFKSAALCMAKNSHFESAGAYYSQSNDFENAFSYYWLGANQGNEHCMDGIAKLYKDKNIEISQDLMNQIKEAYNQKLDQTFQELLAKATDRDSTPADWRAVADIYVKKGMPDSAIPWFFKASQSDNCLWKNLGNLYAAVNKFEEAFSCYEKGAVKLDEYSMWEIEQLAKENKIQNGEERARQIKNFYNKSIQDEITRLESEMVKIKNEMYKIESGTDKKAEAVRKHMSLSDEIGLLSRKLA